MSDERSILVALSEENVLGGGWRGGIKTVNEALRRGQHKFTEYDCYKIE